MTDQNTTRRGLADWRNPEVEARIHALDAAFEAALSPEQQAIYRELEDLWGECNYLEQKRFVEQLAAHFPGLAPAIFAITDGGHGDVTSGRCCEYWQRV
jgi:hypothetical protein